MRCCEKNGIEERGGGQLRRSRLFGIARRKQLLCNKLFFYEYFHTNENTQNYTSRSINPVNMHKIHINEKTNKYMSEMRSIKKE